MTDFKFEPKIYGDVFYTVIDPHRLSELDTRNPDDDILSELQSVDLASAFEPHQIHDLQSANACLSGLYLLYDHLDESHDLSQSIPTITGSFWHAIMHRREGDYWNSKYWFRQVGNHPVYPHLLGLAQLISASNNTNGETYFPQVTEWDPLRFVDFVQNATVSRSADEKIAKMIQRVEWQLLFDYSYKKACGIEYL
jgi:hypothetical protein